MRKSLLKTLVLALFFPFCAYTYYYFDGRPSYGLKIVFLCIVGYIAVLVLITAISLIYGKLSK